MSLLLDLCLKCARNCERATKQLYTYHPRKPRLVMSTLQHGSIALAAFIQ